MAVHIKPSRLFKGMSEDEALGYLNDNKAFMVVKKSK